MRLATAYAYLAHEGGDDAVEAAGLVALQRTEQELVCERVCEQGHERARVSQGATDTLSRHQPRLSSTPLSAAQSALPPVAAAQVCSFQPCWVRLAACS